MTPLSDPTDWISSMVTVVKPNKLLICIDYKDLNRAIKRSYYPMPTIEEVTTTFSGVAREKLLVMLIDEDIVHEGL